MKPITINPKERYNRAWTPKQPVWFQKNDDDKLSGEALELEKQRWKEIENRHKEAQVERWKNEHDNRMAKRAEAGLPTTPFRRGNRK